MLINLFKRTEAAATVVTAAAMVTAAATTTAAIYTAVVTAATTAEVRHVHEYVWSIEFCFLGCGSEKENNYKT